MEDVNVLKINIKPIINVITVQLIVQSVIQAQIAQDVLIMHLRITAEFANAIAHIKDKENIVAIRDVMDVLQIIHLNAQDVGMMPH